MIDLKAPKIDPWNTKTKHPLQAAESVLHKTHLAQPQNTYVEPVG